MGCIVMNQKISDKYCHNRDDYATRFPAAYRFVRALENGAAYGLWLSTATNAHVYKHNAFLAYIRFGSVRHANPTLILSPKYHITIAQAASDEAHLLFPWLVLQTLHKHSKERSNFWTARVNDAFELQTTTPDAVFDDLFRVLRDAEVPASGSPTGR